jgi:hypothetical protein
MTKRFKLTPDLTCPELDGYKLPEIPNYQDDDIEGMAESQYGTDIDSIRGGNPYDLNKDLKSGFVRGYSKAREKYEFTESQLRQALSMAFMTIQDGGNITSDEIIASLRTPRIPIAIEVEMVEVWVASGWAVGSYVNRPAKHPDGTLKGKYIYSLPDEQPE